MKRSKRVVEQRFQSVCIRSPGLQACSVAQNDHVLPVRTTRLNLFDPVAIDDDGTVNAQKRLWIEGFLESTHGHMQKMAGPANVQLHIVLRAANPIDVGDIQKYGLTR